MHYITLDTNTWIYLANGTEPVKILVFIKREIERGNITILLPEIIINEWNKNKERGVRQGGLKHYKDVNDALDRIDKLLGTSNEEKFNFLFSEENEKDDMKNFIKKFKEKRKEIEDAIANNIKIIDDLFKHKNTVIIKLKDHLILKAGQFALEKKAPFHNKNSFADALIFFGFIDYVKTENIKGAIFITYNIVDFCEKISERKQLHNDLLPHFIESESVFYTIVGEAMNTIENDIITKEELAFIKRQQEELERKIYYCEICSDNNDRYNEIYFGKPIELFDERSNLIVEDPDQQKLDLKIILPITKRERRYTSIQVANCSWCSTEHFLCASCGTLNSVWEGEYNEEKQCEGCGLPYFIDTSADKENIGEGHIYKI